MMLLFAFILQACDPVQKDWDDARSVNKVESYQKFLVKHPESVFKKDANQKIDSILFKNALTKLNIKNHKFENFNPDKINLVFNDLSKNDIEDLIKVLIERRNYLADTSGFIMPVKNAEGADLSTILKRTNDLNGSSVSIYGDNTRIASNVVGALVEKISGNTIYMNNALVILNGEKVDGADVDKINLKGSFTVKKFKNGILYSTFYPHDELYDTFGGYGSLPKFKIPYGNNTVIRITGELDNYFKDVSIKSDASFPLHLLVNKNRLYYLMGKGEIKVNNAKPMIF